MANLEVLTVDNIKVGQFIVNRNNPEWGEHRVGQDRNGWIHGNSRGSSMLQEYEFKFWDIVP